MNTPIKFKELTLKNFMSYGNNVTTINLDFNEPRLIIGRNHDSTVNGQMDSNGAGKSAILDALAFALYDKTISNKGKASLINNVNKKDLEVTLTFEKNGFTYKIVRMRKTKTKADVQLLIQGTDGQYKDKTPDSISNTNSEIETIIGLPFDVFARIIVFSATFQPFLDLPSRHASQASQTSIMEELFGYTELTEKANALKEQIRGVKAEFAHLEELQNQINQEIVRHEAQIESVKQRVADWDSTHAERIESLETAIGELSAVNVDKERQLLASIEGQRELVREYASQKNVALAELTSLRQRASKAASRREQFDGWKAKVAEIEESVDFEKEQKIVDKISELVDTAQEAYDMAKYLKGQIAQKQSDVDAAQKEIEHLNDDTCPYCKQHFANSEDKKNELETLVGTLKSEIADLEKQVQESVDACSDAEGKIEKLEKASKVQGHAGNLRSLRGEYEAYLAQIESFIDEGIDEDGSELEDKVSEITKLMEAEQAKLDELKDQCQFGSLADVERVAAKIESSEGALKDALVAENPHTSTLEELKAVEFDNDKSEKLNELEETLRHQEFLLKLLTKKDSFVRKNLLDRSLPFLNKRLMGYLEKLGLQHRVEFQPDMTAKISQFGTELEFGNLSSGQKARVNLALAFAFRDVLQARYGKITFCMLDECLDTGLSNAGVQAAAKMIKEIAHEDSMSMFVISHRDEIASMFKSQMVVELKNGFSNITEQA